MENLLGLDLQNLLKEAIQNKFEYNEKKFYIARVVNNNDPEKLGRVQAKVFGIFDMLPEEDLPWALPDSNFMGSSLGSFIVPKNETLINVYFENDDIYFPKYTTKVIHKSSLEEMESGYKEDYPNTMVFFETDEGDYFKINRKTKEITFRHSSGLKIFVDEKGKLLIDNESMGSDISIKSNGNITLESMGDISFKTGPMGDIRLVSGNGTTSLWQPNILPNCMFTRLPHSTKSMGIESLKGI